MKIKYIEIAFVMWYRAYHSPTWQKGQVPCLALGLIGYPHQAKLIAQPLELGLVYQDLHVFILPSSNLLLLKPDYL